MNKADLILQVAEKTGFKKKDAEHALDAFLLSLEEALAKGETVRLVGFGTFETKERKARQGRNPQHPEKVIEIPATKAVTFKAGKTLKEAINR